MNWTFEEMDRLFNPSTVAVVGDKRERGFMWLNALRAFKGRVYSVQLDEEQARAIEALGFPNYKSLLDIPDPVDYVIVSVPRRAAPAVLRDAIRKGVEGVMFFTAGFAETGEEEGVRLQEELRRLALEARLKVVGPNCMGIFNPAIGLRQYPDQYAGESGPVAFISQSGTHAGLFSTVGYAHGILISKSVSMGNGIVLHAADYLEYFAQDPATGLVATYLEGVPDGRRFFQVLRRTTPRKPVVIWKGGQTEEGARAARSHTASLAASFALWDSAIRQAGAIRVDTFDELIDTVKALLCLKEPRGPRMGLVAMTGGQSVVVSDACARAGLEVPPLTEGSYREFATFYSTVGGSYRNPLDMSPNMDDLGRVRRALEVLAGDPNVDALLYEVNVAFTSRRGKLLERLVAMLGEMARGLEKPLACVLTAGALEKEAVDVRRALQAQGLAVFPGFHRAALAYRRVLDYYRARREMAG